jgi:hypothetical protein
MAHSNEPLFVLCSPTLHPQWYTANRVFDHDKKGYITVGDLTAQIERVTTNPRWVEFAERLADMVHGQVTEPDIREETRDQPDVTSEDFPGDPTSGPAA